MRSADGKEPIDRPRCAEGLAPRRQAKRQCIGVEAGSLSEDHIARLGLDYRAFTDLDQVLAALTAQEIDAVVDDAAPLEYVDQQYSTLPIQVVGKVFQARKYAFALPLNSPLTHDVTVALLSLEEDQTTGKLRTHYFGADK